MAAANLFSLILGDSIPYVKAFGLLTDGEKGITIVWRVKS